MRPRVTLLAECPHLLRRVAGWLHAEWFEHLGHSPEQSEAVVRSRAQRGRLPLTLVALAGEEPIGTASLVEDVLPEDWRPAPFLAGVYVVPAWRRRGVGTRLCRDALTEACRLGLDRLHLFTPDHEAFYARLGWESIMPTMIETGETHQVVMFMALPLPFAVTG
jgi:predicted N-acetyltransferase YhbS